MGWEDEASGGQPGAEGREPQAKARHPLLFLGGLTSIQSGGHREMCCGGKSHGEGVGRCGLRAGPVGNQNVTPGKSMAWRSRSFDSLATGNHCSDNCVTSERSKISFGGQNK